ncbi:neuronal acetylcholine receptor subunit alpha-10-like [Hydractinia symbiolongicarpus]|uniref:neuronal acetylcholine receptor subunit alpha-10-like n=1 Tax=Hydractinia symbiolongicarpus TaxID=13093 RepID=UPI00254F3860|nr:neuronal acetylcholine receptor subunit alpha-10-like [Hydractinia symbiolongicarpus]
MFGKHFWHAQVILIFQFHFTNTDSAHDVDRLLTAAADQFYPINSAKATVDESKPKDADDIRSFQQTEKSQRKRRSVDIKNFTTEYDEVKLVKYLLNTYKKDVRPVLNKSDAVQIVFGMAYTQLLDLDEKNQVLVSNVWIRMLWYNHLLKWNKEDFGGIESINIDPKKIWLPDIVLYNNAEETLGSGQMDQFRTKVILRHDGLNKWYAPTILKSRCAINVEYFPFDDQKCTLKFTSWTYDGFRVNITNKSSNADLASYLESGEFELLSAEAMREEAIYTCCTEPYPYVLFTIHIKRKTLFYFNNLIVPCFLITTLGLLTFVLPPATGERITLVITTLLAMTVFMLMIAERTPTTSKITPLIGKYFIASMVIISLSLIATCIVLNLYECNRSVDSVPKFFKVFLIDYMAPLLRVDQPRQRTVRTLVQPVDTVIRSDDRKDGVTTGIRASDENWNFYHNGSETCIRQRHLTSLPREISDGISVLGERARQQDKFEALAEEWQAVAKVADRVFLIFFLLAIAITTGCIFMNG